jgi:hypothetical protein
MRGSATTCTSRPQRSKSPRQPSQPAGASCVPVPHWENSTRQAGSLHRHDTILIRPVRWLSRDPFFPLSSSPLLASSLSSPYRFYRVQTVVSLAFITVCLDIYDQSAATMRIACLQVCLGFRFSPHLTVGSANAAQTVCPASWRRVKQPQSRRCCTL